MSLTPKEYKIVALRECATPEQQRIGESPESIHAYFRDFICKSDYHRPEVETFYVVMLNTRRRILGHVMVSTGTLDTLLVHPREVFRTAIVGNASAIVLVHNHPSGDPTPSEGDIKVTRDLIRGGQLLKIEVLDHVIMGHPEGERKYVSLRELGYFCM